MPSLLCEACGRMEARRDGILCSDCAYYYKVLRDLAGEHPELAVDSFDRIRQIFEWRTKKMELTRHT